MTAPSDVAEKVLEAVEAAVELGWDVKHFIREARDCWEEAQKRRLRADRAEFQRALRPLMAGGE